MKSINKILLLLPMLIGCMIASCSKEDSTEYKGKNYIMLSAIGDNQINENAKKPLKVKLLASCKAKKDVVIKFALKKNEKGAVRLKDEYLTMKKGEKTVIIDIESTHKDVYKEPQSVALTVESSSDKRMQLSSDLMITVIPNVVDTMLTDAQKKLIEGYKRDYNINLYRVLGELKCSVDLIFPPGDYKETFPGPETSSFETTTIITLSKYSTPKTPMLRMVQNPLGLRGWCYERLRLVTDKGYQWSNPTTYGYYTTKAIGYDASKEVFKMELDSIRINPKTMEISFMDYVINEYDERVFNIPFKFYYSAWERQKKMAKEGKTVRVPNGDYPWSDETMSDLIKMGVTFNPDIYFHYSPLNRDSYQNTPSDWFKASAKLDLDGNKMIFHFPYDHDYCSGHTNVTVIFTLKKE